MLKRGSNPVFALVVLWLLQSPFALGQTTAGTISGSVKDSTGAVVPGSAVTARNVETGITRNLSTDAQGRFQFPNLSVGRYEVEASLPGFQTAVRSGIELTVGREAVVNFTLQIGQVTETVEVTGEAPLVEARNAAITGLVDDRQIRDLPLNGRSFDQLVLLQVGTIAARRDQTSTALGGGAKVSISGARPSMNSFLLDGNDINDGRNAMPGGVSGLTMGVDTVREFRVLTNSYSAEYGRAAGGVITAVTRSGTNELHGTAFEFLRNSKLDARNFFDVDPANPTVRSDPPPFKRNQFGFTVGGPIRQNRTFFFGSYEALRDRLGETGTATVPNAQARLGILPGRPAPITVPAAVKPWLALYPLPNGRDFGDGTGEYLFSSSRPVNQDNWSARLDHAFSSNHSIFGRYSFDESDRSEPEFLPFQKEVTASRSQYLTLQADSVLSATTLNVFRSGLTRTAPVTATQYDGFPEGLTFVPGRLFEGGGQLLVTGLIDIGQYLNPQRLVYTMFEWTDDVTLVRGRHTLKTGLMAKKIQDTQNVANADAGRYQVRGGLVDLLQGTTGTSGDFQTIWPTSIRYRSWRQSLLGFYAQDDFKMNTKFTLNLGVREEFMTSPTETAGRCAILPNIYAANSTVGCPYLETFKNNWAPRVGFAWDTRSNSRLVLRGGFGLFYDQPFSRNWGNTGRGMVPYTLRFVVTNVQFPNAVERLNLNSPPTEPADVRMAVYTGTSYVMQYNLNVQSEILRGTGVTIGYMGSQGRKLFRTGNLNIKESVILPDGSKCFNTSSGAVNPACPNGPRTRRGNPAWSNIRAQITDANSNYNSFVLSVNQRFRGGLRLQSSYTFSKIMSDAETVFGQDFSGGEIAVLDPYDQRRDRALAAFHLKHNFVFNYGYDLPFKAEGALGKAVEGWQLSGITNVTTGVPFSAVSACCSNNGSSGSSVIERPDLAPGRNNNPVLGGPDLYFDPTAFANSPAGFYGTVGRNTIIGPRLVTFDFSLLKNTALTERLNLQFRAEFFNLLNRANFDLPTNGIFASNGARVGNAGRITRTATSSRQIQFGLKLVF